MKDKTVSSSAETMVDGSRRGVLVGGVAFAAAAAATRPASAQSAGFVKGPYRSQVSGLVEFKGHNGDKGLAYYARSDAPGTFGTVVVIHHAPAWDDWTMEVVRKLAHQGFLAIAPNLYFRHPGEPDDQAAAARAEGGVSDDQVMGDVEGALAFVKARPEANGKAGVMGFCSGGRHSFIAAARVKGFNAMIDCWGGSVIVADPTKLDPKRPVNPIDYAKDINCPILGLFGNEDQNPDKAQVNAIEEKLKSLGKTYEFHRYDGAGHAFLASERPNYRVEQAMDAWPKVYAFWRKHLA